MRYHELSKPNVPPPARPLRHARQSDGEIKLVIRLLPSVYRWRHVDVLKGEPHAEIGVDTARGSHPQPYDHDGELTRGCRKWIIEAVHDAVERLGLSICIVFAEDDAIYCWPEGVLVVSSRPPKGGLLL
jgi:hypothetical protein